MPLSLLDSFGRARADRRARRVLAQELADYATPADRDELAALIAGRGPAGSEAASILAGKTRVQLHRAG
jgi:putative aminopeptidase FrvX